jgi:hypothetical protein
VVHGHLLEMVVVTQAMDDKERTAQKGWRSPLYQSQERAMKAIYAALVLATAAPAAVHAEIFLSCQGTQTTFGSTRNDALTENVAGFGLIVDLDMKQVRWTTEFSAQARLPINEASDLQIRFGERGWRDAIGTSHPDPIPDPVSGWSEYGKLNRLTGALEYSSQTTWHKNRGDTKRGDVFGGEWKMKCTPSRRVF